MLFLPATVQPVPNRNGKELYINRRLPEDIKNAPLAQLLQW